MTGWVKNIVLASPLIEKIQHKKPNQIETYHFDKQKEKISG